MTEVDQRVVQMRFDDSEFEEKAKKTMKTLDKLSEKLSFSAVAKESDAALNEVVDNVEKIADKAYTIIDRVIDKIKDNIATKLVDFIKSATIDQVTNGWQKYSQMTTAVGTLLSQGHKIEKVNKVLEDLSYFADETSYSFNDMLSGISKFTAAGVKLEDAKVALMGISNWAAMSGQNAETATRVYGQLAQAMGTYMKKQDWMSVQTANMDTQEFRQTALDTAVALGTLKKAGEDAYVSLRATTKKGAEPFTINSFVESLTQGAWMTSEVMVETYKKYATAVEKIKELIEQYSTMYNVTEEIAQKELDNISTLRKATEEEIKNYAELNKISEEVADKKINAGFYNGVTEYSKRTRKSIKDTEADLDQWSEYVSEYSLKAFLNAQEARTFTDVINSVKESVSSVWREIYTSIFGDYNEAKVLWTDMAEGLIDLFTNRLSSIAEIFADWKDEGGRNQMWRGLYAFGYGLSAAIEEIRAVWDDLIQDGRSGVEVLLSISRKIEEAGYRFYGFVQALIENGFFRNMTEALHNIKSFIDQVFGAFYDGVRDAIPDGNFFLHLLVEFSEIIRDLTSNFKLSDTAVDGLRRTFKGLFIILNKSKKTIVEILVKIVLPILNAVFSILGNIVDVVVTITGTIGDIIEYFMPLNKEGSTLVRILSVLTDIIVTIIKLLGNALSWALRKLVPIIGTAIGSIAGLIESIGELFNGKKIKMGDGSTIIKGFKGLKDKILEAWAPLKSFAEIIDEYKDGKGLTNFLHLFADITEGIGNRLLLTLDATAQFLNIMSESKFGKALGYAIKAIRWLIKAGLWLFNNLFIPALKEIITELGLTIESVKGIIDERGILGLLDLIQEVFKTGIFGSLVRTIELINGVIGGNGLGKLFSKGSKMLESMADYFNAAKLNQSAEVLLKVVAALMLLYTLLALITFLPVENYDRMRKAMFEMAIALGMVVGSVFIISAAAALAGGNLIAMAAGFVGVAIAITTALAALNAMVDFLKKVKKEEIVAGIEVLEDVLSMYSWFLIKTIAPLALLAGKSRADVGGMGIAMAGLAASLWLLLKSAQMINGIDTTQIQKLFDFLTGVYLVLSASTAMMLFAAGGKEVHGIAIAIASIGIAFAAIKMILPLCKDVIAQKDVFMEGQEALATFGLFMVAFSASMYFVTSGVNGLISGIASILLLRAYIRIVTDQILPMAEKLVETIVKLGNLLIQANFTDNLNWLAYGAVFIAIAAFMWVLIKNFRWIVGLWAEFDPLAAVAICLTVISSMLIFTNKVIPAIQSLNTMLKSNTSAQNADLARLVFLLVSPIMVIMLSFALIMDSYVDMYNHVMKGKLLSVNVGLVAKETNGAASVFNSIMLSILSLYGGIAATALIVSRTNFDQTKIDAITSIFGAASVLILSLMIPMVVLYTNMAKRLATTGLFDKSTVNKKITFFKSTQDTLTAVLTSMGNTISGIAFIMVAFMTAVGGFALYLAKNRDTIDMDSVMSMMWDMVWMFVIITGAFSVFALILTSTLGNNRLLTSLKSNIWGPTLKSLFTALGTVAFAIGTIVAIVGIISVIGAQLSTNNGEYDRFWKILIAFGLLIAGIFAGFIVLVRMTVPKLGTMGTGISRFTQVLPMIVTIGGLVLTIMSIGIFLLPAIRDLESMDIGKILMIFIGILGVLAVALGALAVTSNTFMYNLGDGTSFFAVKKGIVDTLKILVSVVGPIIAIGEFLLPAIAKLQTMDMGKIFLIFAGIIGSLLVGVGALAMILQESKFKVLNFGSEILTIIKIFVAMVAPILAFAFAWDKIANTIASLSQVPADVIDNINSLLTKITVLMGIMMGLGAIGGLSTKFATGFIIVAAGMVALAGAIWLVCNAIADLHRAFSDGMESGIKNVEKTANQVGDVAIKTTSKKVEKGSPAKKFVEIGKWCDLGLAKGLNDNTKKVAQASTKLADIPLDILTDTYEIASPSKVFYQNGRFIVVGLAEGLASGKSTLSDTMGELGTTISSSLENSLSGLSLEMPDIWGGKDPIETITEGIQNIDAKSILGKIFDISGLSDEEKSQLARYQQQMDYINQKIAEEQEGHATAQQSQELSRLQGAINKITSTSENRSVGEKFLASTFGTTSFTEAVKKLGEDIGINIGTSATGDNVISNITDRVIGSGIDDPNSLLGQVATSVKTGDWSSIGDSIGGNIGSGIIDGIKNSGVYKTLMGIGKFFGLVSEEEYDDYLSDIGEDQKASYIEEKIEEYKKQHSTDLKYAKTYGFRQLEEDAEAYAEKEWKKHKSNGTRVEDTVNQYWNKISSAVDLKAKSEGIKVSINDILKYTTAALQDDKYYDENNKFILDKIDELILDIEKRLGIASPSKLFMWMGKMCGLGAVIGTEEATPKITKALEDQMSEEYKTMSLGMQALDELASGSSYTPTISPIVDMDAFNASTASIGDVMKIDPGKVSSSLNVEGTFGSIAESQYAMANAINNMRADILNALANGEFVKVEVEAVPNESNIYDLVINQNREVYNRTGINNFARI